MDSSHDFSLLTNLPTFLVPHAVMSDCEETHASVMMKQNSIYVY